MSRPQPPVPFRGLHPSGPSNTDSATGIPRVRYALLAGLVALVGLGIAIPGTRPGYAQGQSLTPTRPAVTTTLTSTTTITPGTPQIATDATSPALTPVPTETPAPTSTPFEQLALNLAVAPPDVIAGDVVTVTITYTNLGTVPARTVAITVSPAAGLAVLDLSPGLMPVNDGRYAFQSEALPPGASGEMWFAARLITPTAASMLVAQAEIHSDAGPPLYAAPAQVSVQPTPTPTPSPPPPTEPPPSPTPTPTEPPPSPTPTPTEPPPPTAAGVAANVPPPDQPDAEQEESGIPERWSPSLGWLLPVAGATLILLGGVALLALVALWLLRAGRRKQPRPAPPPAAAIPFLKSSDGSLYFRLDRLDGDGLVIGRGKRGVDFRIDESVPHADTVAERHARIYRDPVSGYVIIEALDSTNMIFINGRRAPRKNLIKDGWTVGLGKITLTYRDGESDTGPLD